MIDNKKYYEQERAKLFKHLNDIQKAKIIADHYLRIYSIAREIPNAINAIENYNPTDVDKVTLTDYIKYCSDKINDEHYKTFGTNIIPEIENDDKD